MTETQSAANAASAAGIVSWIRNIDIKKVATVVGALTLLEMAIAHGDIVLAGVPDAWMPIIKTWCNNFIFINNALLLGHVSTAVSWPKPANPKINNMAVLALCIVAAAIAFLSPAHAATAAGVRRAHHALRVAALKLPALPIPLPKPAPQAPAVAPAAEPSATSVAQNILVTAPADIAYAIQLANQANTAQSNVRKQCYEAIQAAIPTPPSGTTLPPGPDVVTHIEQAAELADTLNTSSPVFVNCAGAAALEGQTVLNFVNAVVTGIAGIAVLAPKIP